MTKILTALTYVPRVMVPDVMRVGLHSSEALLDKPELLNRIAKARGEDPDVWRASIRRHLVGWKRESVQGPNVMFKGPPSGLTLAAENPLRTMDLAPLQVDLDRFLRENPGVRIHGSELVPYSDADAFLHGDAYPAMRHHDLTPKELAKLSRTSARKLWQHYDPVTAGAKYAPNVPHASILLPGGILPARYLTALFAKRDLAYLQA